MRIEDQRPRRHYAEVLRALGAQLDDISAGDVTLVELEHGFLVQAATNPADPSAHGNGVERVERIVTDPEIERAIEEGHARRASGREAGTIERALRVVGSQVDLHGSSGVLVLQQGDGWVLRHLVPDGVTRSVIQDFLGPRLEEIRMIAAGRRRYTTPPRRRLFGR